MVRMIPERFRVPVAIGVGVLGAAVLISSYSTWQSGAFYGSSFNMVRAMFGLLILWVASHVYRHQYD
jgi:hypothetical protein